MSTINNEIGERKRFGENILFTENGQGKNYISIFEVGGE
jgi:hypothetical protein